MHLKKLWISDYKNLKDFTINFNQQTFYEIIIGKNGSGKSNLFEAVIQIFEFLKDQSLLGYDFQLEYSLKNSDHAIVYQKNKLLHNGTEVKNIKHEFLPDNILIYYSGHNKRISELITLYEDNYRKGIKSNEPKDIRFLLGINAEHKNILLMILLLLGDKNTSYINVIAKLNIDSLNSEIKFVLKKPFYYDKQLNAWDVDTEYWNIKGYLETFLKTLKAKESKGGVPVRDEGYFSDREKYYFYIKLTDLVSISAVHNPLTIFQHLDDLRVIGMLDEISLEIKLKNGERISPHEFSDGEIQTVFFNSIVELFSDLECIILLDEPDAFLHPEWQSNLTKQLSNLLASPNQKNHVLITSHCASTIVSSEVNNISFFQSIDYKIKSDLVHKHYAVKELSNNHYFLDEDKQTLCILQEITLEKKPILFVEGHSDIMIIEEAWRRLRNSPIPFATFPAFSRSQLRTLLQRDELYNKSEIKLFFGLFDFDDAYNEWNSIKGDVEEADPKKGIRKKIKDKNIYAFLIPVPENDKLINQVIKNVDNNETFCHESQHSIELLFYGYHLVKDSFEEVASSGGGTRIKFKGNDKEGFAKKIVPQLPDEPFRVFEPIFNFIESKI